jgi:hypothetical protein
MVVITSEIIYLLKALLIKPEGFYSRKAGKTGF